MSQPQAYKVFVDKLLDLTGDSDIVACLNKFEIVAGPSSSHPLHGQDGHCLCGHPIVHPCYWQLANRCTILVGSTCIRHFAFKHDLLSRSNEQIDILRRTKLGLSDIGTCVACNSGRRIGRSTWMWGPLGVHIHAKCLESLNNRLDKAIGRLRLAGVPFVQSPDPIGDEQWCLDLDLLGVNDVELAQWNKTLLTKAARGWDEVKAEQDLLTDLYYRIESDKGRLWKQVRPVIKEKGLLPGMASLRITWMNNLTELATKGQNTLRGKDLDFVTDMVSQGAEVRLTPGRIRYILLLMSRLAVN